MKSPHQKPPKDIPAPHLSLMQEIWNSPPIGSGLAADIKTVSPLGGTGILSGVTLDQNRVDRELAAERESAETLQRTLDGIDQIFSIPPQVNKALWKRDEITPEENEVWRKFQEHCVEWGLPCLPETRPQAIATPRAATPPRRRAA